MRSVKGTLSTCAVMLIVVLTGCQNQGTLDSKDELSEAPSRGASEPLWDVYETTFWKQWELEAANSDGFWRDTEDTVTDTLLNPTFIVNQSYTAVTDIAGGTIGAIGANIVNSWLWHEPTDDERAEEAWTAVQNKIEDIDGDVQGLQEQIESTDASVQNDTCNEANSVPADMVNAIVTSSAESFESIQNKIQGKAEVYPREITDLINDLKTQQDNINVYLGEAIPICRDLAPDFMTYMSYLARYMAAYSFADTMLQNLYYFQATVVAGGSASLTSDGIQIPAFCTDSNTEFLCKKVQKNSERMVDRFTKWNTPGGVSKEFIECFTINARECAKPA